jgi:hypothetical protein
VGRALGAPRAGRGVRRVAWPLGARVAGRAGSLDYHKRTLANLRAAMQAVRRMCAVMVGRRTAGAAAQTRPWQAAARACRL